MAGWFFLSFSLLGALLVANAARASRRPNLLVISWLAAFLTTDLAPFHILLAAGVAAAFTWGGALETVQGQAALLIVVVSSAWLAVLWLPNRHAAGRATAVSAELELDPVDTVSRKLLLTPFKRIVSGVAVDRDIEFSRPAGRSLALDIYRPELNADRRPALLYLHGGGWIVGDKSNQGLPLCNHMAQLGWVCANANYRLSPGATYPDHVDDAKEAVAWLREHSDEYGVDPASVLAVTFTNKAAGEMRERVRQLLGGEPSGMWIGTFHAIGARLLRRQGAKVFEQAVDIAGVLAEDRGSEPIADGSGEFRCGVWRGRPGCRIDTADADGIDAHSEHGVLKITIPKQEVAQSRRISVKQ